MDIDKVIIEPIITEKMTGKGEELNQFGFYVHKDANKLQVKDAIEKTYGVNVDSVNTMNVKGRSMTRYTKTGILKGRTNDRKKAVVRLVEGDTIDLYSNI